MNYFQEQTKTQIQMSCDDERYEIFTYYTPHGTKFSVIEKPKEEEKEKIRETLEKCKIKL
jgi:hypothetical protein